MQIFEVGGSVRDALLGLQSQDRDYVVVGATLDEMTALGYKPVGADFPVFLHPKTHAEYALARTERKTAPGYRGFVFHTSPDVTLEQDLARRDFTINAIARDAAGTLIDPHGGESDIKARILRHVGDAFIEDPVRVLRGARFAARFADLDFRVAPETVTLMQAIGESGELDHLVPERVWQEIARGLMEAKPSAMFTVLRDCGALARILPEVDRLFGLPQAAEQISESKPEIDTGGHVMMVIDYAAKQDQSLSIRFAALTQHIGKSAAPAEQNGVEQIKGLCERLRVPNDCRDLAVLCARWGGEVHMAASLPAERLLALIDGADALRRPERFREMIAACACDHHGRPGFENVPYPPYEHLLAALIGLQNIDQAAIAKSAKVATEISDAIYQAKLVALQTIVNDQRNPK